MSVFMPGAFFTRPNDTTAYTANDLVANDTTVGNVKPFAFNVERSKGTGIIVGAKLAKSTNTTTLAKFDLHLFHRAPTPTNGDNGAFAIDTAQFYVGKFSFDMTSGAESGTAFLTSIVQAQSYGIAFDAIAHGLAASNFQQPQVVYGFLVATAAYVPAALEQFHAALMIEGGP